MMTIFLRLNATASLSNIFNYYTRARKLYAQLVTSALNKIYKLKRVINNFPQHFLKFSN